MPVIIVNTFIKAPIGITFDLARSIDLHILSTQGTNEKAIAGRTSGLAELNDTITWKATHFGIRQKLTSKITGIEAPYFFRDDMLSGAFSKMWHEHFFEEAEGSTVMKDFFYYKSPMGFFGRIFDKLILENYMRRFLEKRNAVIRHYAETGDWQGKIRLSTETYTQPGA